jgi:hypothetical protein
MDMKTLNKLIARDNEPVTITIYQPNGDPYLAADGSESTMDVVGAESELYRKAERRQQRRLFKRARLSQANIKPEEAEAEAIELCASGVVAWHGWEDDGKPWKCEHANVKLLLGVKHIFDQVNAGINGHASFFEKSSGS